MTRHRYIIRVGLIASLLLTYPANTVRASEPVWPQFRGPGGLGITPDDQAYPTKLDMSKNLLWKTEVPKGHSSPCIWGARGYYYASPVAADGKVYFCSQLGMVVVVQAGETFKVLSRSKLGERINATPALLDGKVYLRTAKHVMAFGGS